MDNKTLATILFRTLGVTYLLYGLLYAPYFLITATYYNGTLIVASLGLLSYLGSGVCLLLLSKPLSALVIKGLESATILPPPPPTFKNDA